MNLVADLLEDSRRALGREEAGSDEVLLPDTELMGRLDGVQQVVLVLPAHLVPEPPKRFARTDRIAGGVLNSAVDEVAIVRAAPSCPIALRISVRTFCTREMEIDTIFPMGLVVQGV